MKDLSIGKEGPLIFKFAMPMVLGNVFLQMYNVIDSIIVGNYIGKEALAAVGASFPILFTLTSLIIGIATGSTIIISQFFGTKDMKKVLRAIDTLYIFLFFSSIVVSVFGIIFAEEIFKLIKLPEEVLPDAITYLQIYLAGLVLFFLFYGTSAILRGLGDSKTPLYFMIVSTIANIIFDLVFVIWFKWEVAGVAIATLISQGGAFVTAIYYLNRTHEVINLSWRKLIFDKPIFKQSSRIGFPIGLQQVFVALSMVVMYWLVNPFGTDTVAAYSVVFRIDAFAVMPAMMFAAALSTFVGQNLGANKPERVKKGLISTFYMTSAIALTVAVIALIFSRSLMSMFTLDEHVIAIGVEYLHIVSFFYIAFAGMLTIGAVMRGAGDTLIPMFITIFALWVVRIPVCYYLAESMGSNGVWWGIPIAWIVGMILSYLYYLTGRWKSKSILRKG
ncbi:MAG: MATE family efflux transporter [Bacteroidetes bacterium]|nr:MATE family efflux transporter [Bacteroidota bacterium]